MAKKLKFIILHCSDSEWGDVAEIRKWHLERGWRDIGYGAVILNGHRKPKSQYNEKTDGLIESGRGFNIDTLIDENERGAHTLDYNSTSLGLCLIGRTRFTYEQFKSALLFCAFFSRVVPGIQFLGHGETPRSSKTCPNFNMDRFRMLLSDENYLENFMIDNVMSDYIKGQ